MKKVYWIVGGAVFVSVVFFIPDSSGSIWNALWLSSGAALLYLLFFSRVWLGKITSPGKKRAVVAVLGALVFFSGLSAYFAYMSGLRTQKRLPEIRQSIEQGVGKLYVERPLLATLRTYYHEDTGQNMEEIFREKYDSLLTRENVFQYGLRGNKDPKAMKIYLAAAEPDSIVLVAESQLVAGNDPSYTNYSGTKGKMELRGILTPKGIHYERQN